MAVYEKVVVAYFFSIPTKKLPSVLFSMARDRGKVRKLKGVSFAKLLGCGTGETFTPNDADLNRWGIIATVEKSQLGHFDSSQVLTRWRRRSHSEFRAVMKPLSSHGLWSGQNPFDFVEAQSHPDSQIAAITRARIKWSKNLIFWRSVPPVVSDLQQSPGLIAAIGIGEAPIGLQGTFSLWKSAGDLREFAYRGAAHQRAIADTQRFGWYSEELFARFEILEIRGSITAK